MQHISDILSGLNKHQRIAVTATEGPLLVLAGAGSGKTRVIAHRIAYLIQNGVRPERICAVTFTNKAAGEMRERVQKLVRTASKSATGGFSTPFVGTFHALGVFIIKQHGSQIGISKNFTILDEQDSLKIFKELVEELQLDPDIYSPEQLRASVSRLKNELIGVYDYAREGLESPYERVLANIYTAYEARLQKTNSLDFDDLLCKTVSLLRDRTVVLQYWQKHWDYLHIDEYQDTNLAQYTLSLLLASVHKNIAVVGDIDQAIYSWRGADWRNILNFERDFPNARVVALEENYRSTKIILEAARAVIVHNTERKEIALETKNPPGELLEIRAVENEKKEAEAIVNDIQLLVGEKRYSPSDIAVLFRTNAQSRALEEALMRSAIPYKLVAGVRFYERKEIKDALGYIKFARNPKDSLSLKRIINTPPRGIGKVLEIKYIGRAELSASEREKIKKFEGVIETIKKVSQTKPVHELVKYVIQEAGFKNALTKTKEGADRLANVEELVTVAKKFKNFPPEEGLEKFLEEISLMSDQDLVDTRSEKIHLLTAHASKGLEFKVIIIAGMEEGLFPHTLSQQEGQLEEERRLFYVALTRAKERIVITFTARRMLYGEITFNEPSRFLREIPEHLLNTIFFENSGHDGHNGNDNEYEEETVTH